MKNAAIIVVLAVATPALSQEPAETIILPRETVVFVTVDQALSTHKKPKKAARKGYRAVKAGETIRDAAHVAFPVKIKGRTVIEAGVPVLLRVRPETKTGVYGRLLIETVMVQARDGSAVPLEGRIEAVGVGGRKRPAVRPKNADPRGAAGYALGAAVADATTPVTLPAGGLYQVIASSSVEVGVE